MVNLSNRLAKLEAGKYGSLYRVDGGFIGMPLSDDFAECCNDELMKANFNKWFDSLPRHLQQQYLDETEARTKFINDSFKYFLEDASK